MKRTESPPSVAKYETGGNDLQNLKTQHLTASEDLNRPVVHGLKQEPDYSFDFVGSSEAHKVWETHLGRRKLLLLLLETQAFIESVNLDAKYRYLPNWFVKNVKGLPSSMKTLLKLENLNLSEKYLALSEVRIQTLPESIGELNNLKSLDLSMCVKLKELPNSIGKLLRLENLNLSECHNLQKLPKSIGKLKALKSLNLSRITAESNRLQLVSTKPAKEVLVEPMLSESALPRTSTCINLEQLLESIGDLQGLENLNLSECQRLENLPESIGKLKRLKSLDLSGCVNLMKLPNSIGAFLELENLNLYECRRLEKLPESIGELMRLKYLDLRQCMELEKIPKSVSELQELKILNLSVSVPSSLWNDVRWPQILTCLMAQFASAKAKSQIQDLGDLHINLCDYESWRQFILSLGDALENSSKPNFLSEARKMIRTARFERYIASSTHRFNGMLNQLLQAPSSPIKRVFEFSDTPADLLTSKRGARILCGLNTSKVGLEFYFEDERGMCRVVGIGIAHSKAVLTTNLETLVLHDLNNPTWKYALANLASDEDRFDNLFVMSPHVDEDQKLRCTKGSREINGLSSKTLGVGFKASDETDIAVSFNPSDSAVCTSDAEVTSLLWEVAKHFLLKRVVTPFVGKNEGSYLSYFGNSNIGDSGDEKDNSCNSHQGECSSQSIAPISSVGSQNSPGGDAQYGADDESGGGDKDKDPNPPRNVIDGENWNGEQEKSATVTLVFIDGVGEFSSFTEPDVPLCLKKNARIFPEIRFHFVKKSSHERKIKIGSKVEFGLSHDAQPTLRPSDEFGWLQDLLEIHMSCLGQKPTSLDVGHDLLNDFDGTPLVDTGKSVQTTNCAHQDTKTTESGTEIAGSVKVLPVGFDVKSSSKTANAHQASSEKQMLRETPTRSNLPGGFTFMNASSRISGYLGYKIFFPEPLCEAIPNSMVLWTSNADRRSIMASGRCTSFNATLQGIWRINDQKKEGEINPDDQEQIEYSFECQRVLSKWLRDPKSQNGYNEKIVHHAANMLFYLNHAMTHLEEIPKPANFEISEGKKADVPNIIQQMY